MIGSSGVGRLRIHSMYGNTVLVHICPEETHIQMIQNQESDGGKTIGDCRLEALSSSARQKERK
jgi:hypothetical protein